LQLNEAKMTKYIIKNKLSYPISFTFFYGIFQFAKDRNDFNFLILSLIIMILILSLLSFAKTDNYIQKLLIENESIDIQYQKNLSKNNPHIFTTNLKSIKSYKFAATSFLGSFHSISIRFIDEDNLHDEITFRSNNDEYFIDLIYLLKKIKTKPNHQ